MPKKLILAAVADFHFSTKIHELARGLGKEVFFLRTPTEVFRPFTVTPELIIVDLNNTKVDALSLITRIKRDPKLSSIPMVGYLSHVQVQLKQQAEQAGCNRVVPRTHFAERMKSYLEGSFL
ncbi:MAG TPA: hypothetical protein VJB87_04755 [Candidatus Nanoarchaeia archaeon]|nr:hypothetical protein [Candidatus Nanoarchaeia archaeon]